MSTSKHTPDLWKVIDTPHLGVLVTTDDEQTVICELYKARGKGRANARLIAAAPELLEVLRRVTIEASHFLHGNRDNATALENELKNALAAIAKATGGAA